MKQINGLFDKILKDNTVADVLGEGSFSVIFDVDNKAYKVTSEIDENEAKKIQTESNNLASKGVKVPYIFDVDVFDANAKDTVFNIKRLMKNSEKSKHYALLKDYGITLNRREQHGSLVGISQQKIDGKTCFDFDKYKTIRQTNKLKVKNNKTPPPLLPDLEAELHKNLMTFLPFETRVFTAFIRDGATILQNGVSVDNLLGSNFLVARDGFYYIDIGATPTSEYIFEKNVFNFTVENICRMVYSISTNLSPEIYQKQLELCDKLWESMKESCSSQFVKGQFDEYMQKDNLFKKLLAHAHFFGEKTDTKKYDNLVKEVFEKQNENQK